MINYKLIGILLLMTFSVWGQNLGINSADKGKMTDGASQAENLFLAYQSAKFGRVNKAPDALIFAATILKTTVSDKIQLEKQIEGGQPDLVKKETKTNMTAESFLSEAKMFAKKDKDLLGRIKTVAKMTPGLKGALGGPKRAITEVKAFATDVITVRFKGGETAVVAVSGDGETDLDLYIYDENNNLISSDTGGSDNCKVRFFPKWSGNFKIKVKNLGNVYNRYLLVTN